MKWITEVMEEQAREEQKETLKNLKINKMSNEISRRNRMDLWTPAEKAIHDALIAVEKAGADVRLTEAVILLDNARRKVADFVDDQQLNEAINNTTFPVSGATNQSEAATV